MHIYICDDSRTDLFRLKHFLNKYLSESGLKADIHEFTSGEELIQTYSRALHKPILIFLDIYMNDLDGITIARQLRDQGQRCEIIFTTASTHHAMDSYNVNALYYLQKPYTYQDFLNAVKRSGIFHKNTQNTYEVHYRGIRIPIPVSDIMYFETADHAIVIHTTSDTFSVRKLLSAVREDFTGNPQFISIGKSFFIHLPFIKEMTDQEIVMTDGSIIPIPVRLRKSIRAQIYADYFS